MADLRRRFADFRIRQRTARALMPPPASAFKRFGERSVIAPPARIEGAEFISIGDRVLIHEHSWLMAKARPGQPAPSLVLEDTAKTNRFVKIVCLLEVHIGHGAMLSDRVYVSDVEYVPGATDVPPADRELTEPRPVRIGKGVFVGVGAVIKPGVTIGDWAYVAAGAIVNKDVPARTLVAGAPARAVRTWDPS
ncbi:MAG: acyltransferase [Frankiales bacterium]|nr:acyltransferase [Frankiales bacterium]